MLGDGALESPHYGLVPKTYAANLKFRRDVLELAGTQPGHALRLRQMCAEDLLFYVNAFVWTYSPKDGGASSVVPFITYSFQDRAMLQMLSCVINGTDFTIPKSRDMGASWMGLTIFEWLWHFYGNLSFLLISRNEDYVDKKGNPKSLFWKVDFIHENEPRWLLPTDRWSGWNDPSRRLLHLGNSDTGSMIDGESTTGDAGRGDRRTAMFIDEHAAFEINDGFRVLRATRDTTNCRGFNSTPQGANNGFYEVVHNTAAKMIRLHWSEHPLKNVGLYSSKKDGATYKLELLSDFQGVVKVLRKGDKEAREELYPDTYPFVLDGKMRSPWYDNESARCVSSMEIAQELDIDFKGSDYQFFDAAAIEALRIRYCRKPDLVGDLEFDLESCTPKRFVEHPKGKLVLWMTLDGDGKVDASRKFVIGSDIAAGTGASNSVCSIGDRLTGEKLGVWRDPNTLPKDFGRLNVALAKFFNSALIVPDRSGPTGEVCVREIVKQGYGNLYYRRNEKKIGRNISDEPGVFLNSQAKSTLLEDYRDALGNHQFINRSEVGVQECLQFIRKAADGAIEHSAAIHSQDPSGARTAHGDEVIADALCCLGIQDTQVERHQEAPVTPVGSLAWRMEQRDHDRRFATADILGEGW